MSDDEIKLNLLERYSYKELVEIYIINDTAIWPEQSINIIKDVLYDRYGELPQCISNSKTNNINIYELISKDLFDKINEIGLCSSIYYNIVKLAKKIMYLLMVLLLPIGLNTLSSYTKNNIVDLNMFLPIFIIFACSSAAIFTFLHLNKDKLIGAELYDIIKYLKHNKVAQALQLCDSVISCKCNNTFIVKEAFVRGVSIFVKTCFASNTKVDLINDGIDIFEKLSVWHPNSYINYLALAIFYYRTDNYKDALHNIDKYNKFDNSDDYMSMMYSSSNYLSQFMTHPEQEPVLVQI